MVKDALEKKSDSAAAALASFRELKAAAHTIWQRMYDKEIVTYDGLGAGEPKVLAQFYFKATGEKGITSKCSNVPDTISFLNSIDDDVFEQLFLLDVPPSYKHVEEVDSVAANPLKDMSTGVRETLKGQQQSERESVLAASP